MQKVKYLLVLVMSIFSFSCQKSNMYSCDPDIERWANGNVLEISRMSRMQFLNLKRIHIKELLIESLILKRNEKYGTKNTKSWKS